MYILEYMCQSLDMKPSKVGIYLRVSTSDQSTDLQRRELEAHAVSRGWTDLTWFEDKATGTNVNRPQFRRIMVEARARRLDIIVVWKLDRFARSLRDLILNLQELTDLGVAFVSMRDQIDLSTSTGRLMLHMIGAFAQFEADMIRDRVNAGIAAAKANGTRFGRPPRLDPARAHELRSQGWSLSRIARELGTSKSAVSKVLRKSRCPNPVNKPETIGSPNPASEGGKT
jgi:putative DNA-invertase from lambdoid prophage Rac